MNEKIPIRTGGKAQIKSNNNAAIISLLNSAPAAMTSSTVVNNLNTSAVTSPCAGQATSTTDGPPPQQSQQHQQTPKGSPLVQSQSQTLAQNLLQGAARKISFQPNQLQNPNRVLNSTNLIAVNANTVLGTGQMIGIQGHTTPTLIAQDVLQATNQPNVQQINSQGNQQLSVRVTMSALASQLSSPPAMMSSSSINPQNFNFAQIKSTSQSAHPNQNQSIILNSNSASSTPSNRMLGHQAVRRDSLAAPSPGSDSNASNASSTNLSSFSMNPGFPFLGPSTSPTASIISGDGSFQLNSQNDRLTNNASNPLSQQSISSHQSPSPLSSVSSTHFMAPSPKNNLSQHIQVQSPNSVSPMSSPPLQVIQTQQPQSSATPTANTNQQQQQQPAQTTTTLNLQGINLSSLQGAMATFPGLQNVQVDSSPSV